MLDRIRTLDRPQYARKMHLRPVIVTELCIFNDLNTVRTRVQLPPAPPNNDPDASGEVQKARMAQTLRAFFVSVIVRGHPAKSGDYWYTFRYTVGCIPKSVYQFMKEQPQWHGQHVP